MNDSSTYREPEPPLPWRERMSAWLSEHRAVIVEGAGAVLLLLGIVGRLFGGCVAMTARSNRQDRDLAARWAVERPAAARAWAAAVGLPAEKVHCVSVPYERGRCDLALRQPSGDLTFVRP